MATTFEGIFTVPSHPHFDATHMEYIDGQVNNSATLVPNLKNNRSDNTLTNPVTVQEITNSLKLTKNSSSPGLDGVTYIHLKHLPAAALFTLAKFFTVLIMVGYFPAHWKVAKTILIPKAGKSPLNPNNYRPISLLSCVGKLFERVVGNRLRGHLEDNAILSDTQYGFRAGKSTFCPIFNLTEDIKLGFKRKLNTLAVFLDAEKAFDQTWHNGLKYKLLHLVP